MRQDSELPPPGSFCSNREMSKNWLAALILSAGFIASINSFAQQPRISNIELLEPDHNSVLVKFTVSEAKSFVQVKYGVIPGVYPWTSSSYQMNAAGDSLIAIAGLAPDTTYYFLPVAQMSATNLADACTSVLCGAVEKVYKTPEAPSSPVLPTAPTVYNPAYPDTSEYVTVRIVEGDSECQAADTVSGENPVWTVNAGDTLQKILDTVGYGTVLEFDQNTTCKVANAPPYYDGYIVSPKRIDPLSTGIDDPKHRWIILRTRTESETDFPPHGFRTGPGWASKMAVFKSMQPQRNPFVSGQIFLVNESTAGTTHHFWFDNFATTVDETVQARFTSFFDLGNPTSKFNQANPPDYFVFTRMYMHGPDHASGSHFPSIMNAIWGLPKHFVLRDSYIDNIDTPGEYSIGLYFTDHGTGPMFIDNNYLNCVSMGLYWEYNDTYATTYQDLTVTHNTFHWPVSLMPGAKTWDGRNRRFRNQIETKRSRRLKIDGNLIDGQFSFQNQGQAIFISGTGSKNGGLSGSFDTTVTNNVIRHAASPFECMGVRPADNSGPPDNAVNRRVLFKNNLAYDIGRRHYTVPGSSGGLISSYFSMRPGCQDVTITQNTLGFLDGSSGDPGFNYIPSVFFVGGGATLASGLTFTNNIYYLSIGNPVAFGGIAGDSPQRVKSLPQLPLFNTSGTYKSLLDSFAGNTVFGLESITPTYNWKGNIAIGGRINNTGTDPWPDMSSRNVSSFAAQMPGTDTWVTGNTMADRERSAGLINVDSLDYTVTPTQQNPGIAGASLSEVESAMGIVSDININVSEGTVKIQYVAPDSRSCYVDITSDGKSWTRSKDEGGERPRIVTFSELTLTTDSRYRILCYYDQTASWFSFPSDHTNLETHGQVLRIDPGQ
jgi:hypothetical protein